jgi:hypothetical protein
MISLASSRAWQEMIVTNWMEYSTGLWKEYFNHIGIGLLVFSWMCLVLRRKRRGYTTFLVDSFSMIYAVIYPIGIVYISALSINTPRVLIDNHYLVMFVAACILMIALASFARLYHMVGITEIATGERSKSMLDCLYYSIITWTTVGYGDFVPMSRRSRMVAATESLLGYVTMAALVAGILAGLAASHTGIQTGFLPRQNSN